LERAAVDEGPCFGQCKTQIKSKSLIDIWMRWEEDGGMSENILIHHSSMPGKHDGVEIESLSSSWPQVTCRECQWERPLAEPEKAPEYRVPQHVLDMDRRLGLADELAAAERDYTEAMERAALAAREANAAGAAVARIRTLLAEEEPAWRAVGVDASGGVQSFSAVLSKPGPY
jgi:hypothetical protein